MTEVEEEKFIEQNIVSSSEEDDDSFVPQTYPRRWLVLLIVTLTISMRGYNQSCYGPVNNWLAEYFRVESWQIDWFVVIQSVIFLVASLPMSVVTMRMGYRRAVIAVTSSLTLGFILTTLGVNSRHGFPIALIGQGVMGFSNILSWSLPPPTAAIWFANDEVATAVATQVVGRGVGESIGSFLPTLLLNQNSTISEMKETWVYMFAGMSAISAGLCLSAMAFVTNGPPSPPSKAQMAAQRSQKQPNDKSDSLTAELASAAKEFMRVARLLFKDPIFVAVWLLFGSTNPVLRNNNVLMSSLLHHRFSSTATINKEVGLVLMFAWAMYTVGGFVVGPLITSTRRYKEIAVVSVLMLFVSCLLVFVGVEFEILRLVYGAVVLQGLMVGSCNTTLFELLAEVTYPHPTMFVTMISIICMGMFRLIYPLLGRLLLMYSGSASSTLFPAVVTLMGVILVLWMKPSYKRQFANGASERKMLLRELRDDNK